MKLFLKNGKLSVREPLGPLHKEDDFIQFVPQGFKDPHVYSFEYAINGKAMKPIKDNKIPLDVDLSSCKHLTFVVRTTNLANRKRETYTSEAIPFTTYVYLGSGTESMYPTKLEAMQKEIDELKERATKLESEGDII